MKKNTFKGRTKYDIFTFFSVTQYYFLARIDGKNVTEITAMLTEFFKILSFHKC